MAFDFNVCANTPAPEFVIPEDMSARDRILAMMGYVEIPISITDEGGNTVEVRVAGRVVEGS